MDHLTVMLTLRLSSDWLVASASAGGPDVDAEPATTAEGLPVVPGRTLKGLLRHALETAASFEGDEAKREALQGRIVRWFGTDQGTVTSDERERQLDARRLLTTAGLCRVGSAELGVGDEREAIRDWARACPHELAGLYRRVASTKLAGGVAADTTLRASRVAVPMELHAALTGPAGDPAWQEDLKRAARWLRELGSHRTRGFGRVTVLVSGVVAARTSAATALSGANRLRVGVELLDDVVMSATSATTGDHRCLPYVPGAALLGAAAALTYDQLADPWSVFHSGRVRFLDARPDASGSRSLPVPLALHRDKGGDGSVARNLAIADRPADVQWQPLGGDHVVWIPAHRALRAVASARRFSLRTAIDADGAAGDGMLFSYTALARGTRLWSVVTSDDPALIAPIASALDGAVVRLGRSKSAEYGRARLTVVAEARDAAQALPGAAGVAVFLCASDVCLRDAAGAPRLLPVAADVGLGDGWQLDLGRTFVRTRLWSPFHGHRGRPALDRQVVRAGSVWVFRHREGAAPPADAIARALSGGVGCHTAEGLGEVLFDPSVLRLAEVAVLPPATSAAPSRDGQAAVASISDEAVKAARAWAHEAAAARDLFRRADGIAQALQGFGIERSQWGELRALALRLPTGSGVEVLAQVKAHVAPGEDEVRKGGVGAVRRKRWLKKRGETSAARVLLSELQKPIRADAGDDEQKATPAELVTLVHLVAARAARRAARSAQGVRP